MGFFWQKSLFLLKFFIDMLLLLILPEKPPQISIKVYTITNLEINFSSLIQLNTFIPGQDYLLQVLSPSLIANPCPTERYFL